MKNNTQCFKYAVLSWK